MAYEQAYKDHQYLWDTYGPAEDMTGGYVDSEDLDKLLKSPTRATANQCLESQIDYWFQVGPDPDAGKTNLDVQTILDSDERVREIAERYGCL